MQQLSGMDSAFLAADSHRTPMHIMAVLTYEPHPEHSGDRLLAAIRGRFVAALDESPVFRRKLLYPPLRNDHPYWVDAGDFDLDSHLYHATLPEPGNRKDFCDYLGRLHATRLNLDKPLWEAHLVEGLDDIDGLERGSFCLVLKLHHAAIDGISMTRVIAALHSTERESPAAATAGDWQPQRAPARSQLMWNAYRNTARRRREFWRTLGDVVPALRFAREQSDEAPNVVQKIRTRFNVGVSARRTFGSYSLDFREIRSLRKLVVGATVNDVVVAIIGGALRLYLADKDELPDESLVAGAPINIRPKSGDDPSGNQLSMMRIPLQTDIEDPVKRLAAVHAGAVRSKKFARNVGVHTIRDLTQNVSPQLLMLGIRAANSETLKGLLAAPVHTMVSNVPGPPRDMYCAGARLHEVHGLGPLIDQVGLFHAVTSAGSVMTIGFVACPEAMPDPEHYRDCVAASHRHMLGCLS